MNLANLEQDYTKKLTTIQYNLLNLPSALQLTSGHRIDYLYSSDGMKRRVTHETAIANISVPMGQIKDLTGSQISQTHTTDYCGNVIYENGAFSKILTEEGYVTLSGTTPTYHYYLKDHQGNNRVVINQTGVIEQINHYYPFGGLFEVNTATSGIQSYKYNGKELDRMHGVDWYDYGARMYDAALGIFMMVDPMIEKYYSFNPYAYCLSNPIKFIDTDGKQVYVPAFPLTSPPPIYVPYSQPNTYPSDAEIINFVNQPVRTMKQTLVFLGVMLWSNIEQTKEALSPEYKHQRDRDRRNREGIDQNQANVAKSIEDNVTSQAPGGNPGPKRSPKGELGKTILKVGAGGAVVQSIVEGSEPQIENSTQEGDATSGPSIQNNTNNDENEERDWWNFSLNWFE